MLQVAIKSGTKWHCIKRIQASKKTAAERDAFGRQVSEANAKASAATLRIIRASKVAKIFPLNPKHPDRICWGCEKYCSVDSLNCGNGSDRTQHPVELFGDCWFEFGSKEIKPSNELTENSSG